MPVTLLLAWRNLWRHSRRTWLTVSAMVFSNVLLVFMISLQLSTYDMMIENSIKAFSGQLQISHKGYENDPKMRSTIDSATPLAEGLRSDFPDYAVAMRASTFVFASSTSRSVGLMVSGVEPAHEPTVSTIPNLLVDGRYLSGETGEIVIGEVLARNLDISVGDEITLIGSGYDGSFAAAVATLVGIFSSGVAEVDRSVSQIPMSDFQTIFSMADRAHTIVINGPNIDQVQRYQEAIAAKLVDDDIHVLNWAQVHPVIQQSIDADFVSAWFMYAVLIVLVTFSVLNTQLMSVLERTREFGIMMSIGCSTWRLSRLVVIETCFLSLLGALIGCALGFLLTLYLHYAGLSMAGMEEAAAKYNMASTLYPVVTVQSIFMGPSVLFIGCMLASLYPALRLHRLQPVTAMRAV